MSSPFRPEYRELNGLESAHINDIKDKAEELWRLFQVFDCRESSIAKTKLEEAVMWAVKGITA